MSDDGKYIWINGELVELEKATIHFLSSTLHYGVGAFEGIRCYDTECGPAVFRLKEHIKRLIDSALIMGYREFPYTVAELCEATKKTIAANGFTSCYIRPLVYHDGTCKSLNLDNGKPSVGIATWYWGNYLGEDAMEKGIRANVSSFTRHHPNVMMTKAKISGNYVNSVLARTESARLGFGEAIMLDPQGYVAECTGENIFVVRNGNIYTPPTATILEGITRDSILTIARELGYTVTEQPVSRDQLYSADEVFMCGTAAECVAVTEIDFRTIGSGRMGNITRNIQKTYMDVVQGRHPLSKGWLDYVHS
ncbi:MAG: branched-chain amino acid transaminase [Anaerolineae bacterium]|nr:branched-chain amino acid transaminase [Anaerolineae bacterium]